MAIAGPTEEPSRIRAVPLAVAVLAGALGWSVAPAPWSSGPARLQVEHAGDLVIDREVALGSAQAFALASDSGDVALAAARGLPLDRRFELALTVPGMVVMDDVVVTLVLPDGLRAALEGT